MERGRIPVGATVRCANCDQSWLVPGLRRGETHVCKGCSHPLIVGPRAPRPSRSNNRPKGDLNGYVKTACVVGKP